MSCHLDKILAHAERELVSTKARRPTDVLPLYKKFLKIEEHRLRLRHRAGGGGREVSMLRVELVDVLLRHVFSAAAAFAEQRNGARKSQLALLALGGYGRGELNPFSDVDVMFLHAARATDRSSYVGQMVEQVLYLLWDIGFKVGHSTRSIKEAVVQANRDMLTKTALLESRHIAGDARLVTAFREQFRAKCVRGREREYIELRMNDQAARHAKHQNSVYVQEPDVKRGCGGLRDYQNLLWMTYFKEGALSTQHLVGRDWLSQGDRRDLDVAYDFLLRVRSELHYLTRRATDVLRLNLQERVARRLGYTQKNPLLRSEAFMKDYYKHTRSVFQITERITQQFASGESSGRLRALFNFLPVPKINEEHFESLFSRHGKLYAEERDIFTKEPELMMRAFQLAQQRHLDISPDLAELFTRRLRAVTRTYQYAKRPREMFKGILEKKGEVGRTLRMMHRTDFLGRYIPEFGGLTCLVQHEFFHRYTADEHTLVCIEKLDALRETVNPKLVPYRTLLDELAEPLVLYLALLLHDTGKAVGARPHSEASALFAQRVAARLQLSSEQRKSLILLVDHHLTLSNIAQQRNLDDPETAIEFAKIVKDQKNLDALMLLTLADGQGTSADAWSDWKESLVWHLYHEASRYLADQKTFYEETRIHREALTHALRTTLSDEYSEEIDAHFEFMPDNYFRAFEVDDIASHLRLFRKFFSNLYRQPRPSMVPAIKWESFPEQGHSIASFCTWDRQELLAKIAGSFSTIPINILSADIYTRGDHLVLDVFRVCDAQSKAVTDQLVTAQVEETLRHSLEDEHFDFQPLIAKARQRAGGPSTPEIDFSTQITIDNKAHPSYTLVQVQTPDRLGLLYDMLSCLGRAGIYIALSRISTEKGAAIDTFYIADSATHNKITEAQRIVSLQKELQLAALAGS